jgi:hypothetical protein
MTKTIEESRQFWAKVAKKNGWYKEPFYVQVWVNEEGEITDSVSHRDLTQDYVIQEVMQKCEECEQMHYAEEWCGWEE